MTTPCDPLARYWSYVNKTNSCWLWTGSVTGGGYGRFWVDDRTVLAHRWGWQLWHGRIPDDLVLDHLCRIRNCVNPAHLELVTERENILRGVSFSAENARKTRCANGHRLSGHNLKIKGNLRICMECERAKNRRYEAKRPWRSQARSHASL